MSFDLVIGISLLAVGGVLLFISLPSGGVSPRFLQFEVV